MSIIALCSSRHDKYIVHKNKREQKQCQTSKFSARNIKKHTSQYVVPTGNSNDFLDYFNDEHKCVNIFLVETI